MCFQFQIFDPDILASLIINKGITLRGTGSSRPPKLNRLISLGERKDRLPLHQYCSEAKRSVFYCVGHIISSVRVLTKQ